jgi:hypothetical protein
LYPPATSTNPESNKVAVWLSLATVMLPVGVSDPTDAPQGPIFPEDGADV